MNRGFAYYKLAAIATFVGVVLIFSSCVRDECRQSTEAHTNLSFYSEGNKNNPNSFVLTSSTGDILDVFSNIAEAHLPLNPSNGEISFNFVINDIEDTVTIDYLPEIVLYSPECGYNYQYLLKSVDYSTNIIDSIIIVNSRVTPAKIEYLRVYY